MVPVKAQNNGVSLLQGYAKAFVGAIIAGLSSALSILQTGKHFGAADYVAVVLATLVAFSGIAFTPNKQ